MGTVDRTEQRLGPQTMMLRQISRSLVPREAIEIRPHISCLLFLLFQIKRPNRELATEGGERNGVLISKVLTP